MELDLILNKTSRLQILRVISKIKSYMHIENRFQNPSKCSIKQRKKRFQTRTKRHLKKSRAKQHWFRDNIFGRNMFLHERVSNGSPWVSTKFNTREGRV
jgi:hypothetical protein